MKRLVAAGLATLIVGLIVIFPARVAYNWFAPAELRLSGIEGSVWRGSATEGLAGGAYLRNVSWRYRPTSLIRGQIAFSTQGNAGGGPIDAIVGIGLDGSLILSDVAGMVPLDLVHPTFQQGGIRGDLGLQFSRLVVRDALPVEIDGAITVANLLAPLLSPTVIGNYRADFATTVTGITGEVSSVSGVLNVSGSITLADDRSYTFIGKVSPTPETPVSITNQLRYLGSPDAQGRREFRFEGTL